MQRGYIKLWRKMQDDPLWTEARIFSKAEAWLDILMAVQHSEAQTVIIGMQMITVNQGEAVRSQETWAYRWKWSRGKVQRFLSLLQETNKIRVKNEHATSRITVLNWGIYNKSRSANEQHSSSVRAANERRSSTDKNEEECYKNVKNEGREEFFPAPDPQGDSDLIKLREVWAARIGRDSCEIKKADADALQDSLKIYGLDWCLTALGNESFKSITAKEWFFHARKDAETRTGPKTFDMEAAKREAEKYL